MVILRIIRAALGASSALVMVTGCSGGNPPAAFSQPQVTSTGRADNSLLAPTIARISRQAVATRSFIDRRAAGKPLIFVSDAADGVIDIYPQAGKKEKMVGQITGLTEPQGITTDKNGNLYVANTNSSNVLVYAPPYTGAPKMTISDPHEFPADVAVSSAGIVAITNICSAPKCRINTGNVVLYAKGSTKSCATVSDSAFNFTRVMFAEFDKSGALYIDGLNGGYQTAFGLVTGGCNATSITNLEYVYTVSFPGGIQIDKAGNIAFCDQYQQVVDTFAPPTDDALGQPVLTTPLSGSVAPLGIAILASGTNLYAADSGGSGFAQGVQVHRGRRARKHHSCRRPATGIAVTPPLLKGNN